MSSKLATMANLLEIMQTLSSNIFFHSQFTICRRPVCWLLKTVKSFIGKCNTTQLTVCSLWNIIKYSENLTNFV